jgi:hypothetical protein
MESKKSLLTMQTMLTMSLGAHKIVSEERGERGE